MSVSPNLLIDRRDPTATIPTGLAANVKTAILVPRQAQQVNILNGTTGDLQVHTSDTDDLHFIAITRGYERPFMAAHYQFHAGAIGFWLKPAVSGLVILVWY